MLGKMQLIMYNTMVDFKHLIIMHWYNSSTEGELKENSNKLRFSEVSTEAPKIRQQHSFKRFWLT